ncbi:MAG TPA: PP2C family serine/threonine-protein phosphatase [Gemmatimonas sp.]|nr:PP2C family serine/threonine-protein phosphatase [Gemmatimonas sp.]
MIDDNETVAAVPPQPAEGPARAVWTQLPAEAPWCPPEWAEHLRAVAPAFVAPEGDQGEESTASSIGDAAGWTLASVSRRGRLHAHRGEHREDAAAMLAHPTGWCAAVADGAGSAEYSRIGAALAVHAATTACTSSLRNSASDSGPGAAIQQSATMDTALRAAADAAQRTMADFADRAGIALRVLRTTLLVAVVHGDVLGVLHVGDGAVAFLHADGTATLPTQGHGGDFSGEVAHFLPDDGAHAQLVSSATVSVASNVVGVLLATDGVEDPWYPMSRTAPALFTQLANGVTDDNAAASGVTQPMRGPVLGAPDPLAGLGKWLRFEKRGENDDRTLCVAHRSELAWPSA